MAVWQTLNSPLCKEKSQMEEMAVRTMEVPNTTESGGGCAYLQPGRQ